jgi:hypothetical protein
VSTTSAGPGGRRPPNLIERIAQWFTDHPGQRITAVEGCAMFGCTHSTWLQSIYELRRHGTRVRCEDVWWVDGGH